MSNGHAIAAYGRGTGHRPGSTVPRAEAGASSTAPHRLAEMESGRTTTPVRPDSSSKGRDDGQASAEDSVGDSRGLSWRLRGMEAPAVRLPFAPGKALPGSMVSLAELARRHSLAVFFYGGVISNSAGGGRDEDADVERARTEGWREHEPELEGLGFEIVGVSTQSSEEQARFALDRMLSFAFLSDRELLLANELGLPTREESSGRQFYEPLTMLIRDGHIWWVFYPLDRPELDAEIAIERIGRSHV
jgi:peroxiredoxin